MTRQTAKAEEERIDLAHISLLKEINELKASVYQLKLERDILMAESKMTLTPDELIQKREILDLYLRGYSVENIGTQMGISEEEIESVLAPFTNRKVGRSETGHED